MFSILTDKKDGPFAPFRLAGRVRSMDAFRARAGKGSFIASTLLSGNSLKSRGDALGEPRTGFGTPRATVLGG